jgi:hypothetical protein
MKKDDRQYGWPLGLYQNTKANIEALTGTTGGEIAYATDTGEDGVYDAVAAGWVWGRAGGSGLTWQVVTTDDDLVADNGYVVNSASLVTLTLPATASINGIIRVVGVGAGGWLIEQLADQQIHFGNLSTTVGVTGSVASVHDRDAVELICVVADDEWQVISSVGNLEVT